MGLTKNRHNARLSLRPLKLDYISPKNHPEIFSKMAQLVPPPLIQLDPIFPIA